MSRQFRVNTDQNPSYMHKYKSHFIKPYLPNNKNVKLLDVGCWSAQFYKALDYPVKYYGIDVDREVVKEMSRASILNANFKIGSAQKIPYRNSMFDVVVFSDVIEHLPIGSEILALTEINRVLKKDGIIFLSTPLDFLISILLDPAYFLSGHRHYGSEKLVSMLEKSGFEIVTVQKKGIMWHSVDHLMHLLYKHFFNKPSPKKISKFLESMSEKNLYANKEGYLSLYIIAKKNV